MGVHAWEGGGLGLGRAEVAAERDSPLRLLNTLSLLAAGRLIFELGGIPERELDKLKEEAARLGKQSFAFAFYMDTQKEERARGVTIACTTKEVGSPVSTLDLQPEAGRRRLTLPLTAVPAVLHGQVPLHHHRCSW